MARYIDAEKMKLDYAWWGETKARDLLYEIIDNQPTVEVTKVTRCKDCIWWKKGEHSIQGRCEVHQMYPSAYWYCANGERRDEV